MEFVGVDLHTNRFTSCYLDREGGKQVRSFELDAPGVERFYQTVDEKSSVLVEARSTPSPLRSCSRQR